MNAKFASIIGHLGNEGRYWQRYCMERGYVVMGADPKDPDRAPDLYGRVLENSLIIVAVPIRASLAVLKEITPRLLPEQFCLLVTGLQERQHDILASGEAEFAGLHKMCAPPETCSLKGENLIVCRGRVTASAAWFADFVHRTLAHAYETTPANHDKNMARVQAALIISLLGYADTLNGTGAIIEELLSMGTPIFRMTVAQMARMLSHDPDLYFDMLAFNPYVPECFSKMERRIQAIGRMITNRNPGDRKEFINLFARCRETLGKVLVPASAEFERLHRFMESAA